MLHRLRYLWRKLSDRTGRFFRPHPDRFKEGSSGPPSASQALSAEYGRMRTDLEQTRSVAEGTLRRLEQLGGEIATDQRQTRSRLAELEHRLGEIDAECRLAQDRAYSLEAALAGTGTRLDSAARQLANLDDRATKQLRSLDASVGQAVARIADAENHARSVERQLASRHDRLETCLQKATISQQRYRRRLDRITIAVSGVLLLGIAAGALLIRDMQANTRLLAGMRGDMHVLLASIDKHQVVQPPQVLPVPPKSPVPLPQAAVLPVRSEPAAPAISETPPVRSVPPWQVPSVAGKRDVNRYFLGREIDLFRKTSLAGNDEAVRVVSSNETIEQDGPADIIKTSSGLQYQVFSSGSGRSPRLVDRVALDFLGMTEEGTTFVDTYTDGTPVTLSISELMPGWREALLLMREGAEWGLYVPPHLAQTGRVSSEYPSDPIPGFYLIRLNAVIGRR